ncbi:heparan sulfate glucosamine 3-O-sulfotransferase 1 [Copidosoma floridanum]|uniref:heparan sulfate glucosamine 3-O-sulfotransferase 1 n=1 Tax=Copidosoma floridanum TaxID=29053 RepID=UPI0006C986D1|nr:heparan sulfate glucosamine 3-O-sulfotransferase 1 [Copidosoma floridanum]
MPIKVWSRHQWPPQFPLDILWMPRPAMRPADCDAPSDCILVVGVSRPKLAAAFLTVALLSLFLTFHILYDSAVYSLRAAAQQTNDVHLELLDPLGTTERTPLPSASVFSGNHPVPKAHFPRTNRQLPQAIIIGVRKCGTRALLEMLFLHPQIQKAAGEVHFFDRDENFDRGLEWYRKKMPFSFHGQITIEKSPSYFVTPEVPERIHAMNSSVRLLLIVREPVTRAISDYAQLRSHAATTASPLPNANSTALQQRSFEELAIRADGSVNENYRPISISMYHVHMRRWLSVFSRRQILVVNGDQLIDDPVPQLKRIESFLRLESRIGRHNFYFNRTKGFYCMRDDTEEKCLRESKGRRHPRVSPTAMAALRGFFSGLNRMFYDLIGEDLGWPEQ